MKLVQCFPRIQLNLHSNPDNTDSLLNGLKKRIQEMPEKEFIFPYSSQTASLLQYFSGLKNVAVLFDESQGQGVKPSAWPKNMNDRHCGYAGGISPDNVAQVINSISKIVTINEKYWLDMESGVRTDNQFDLVKVLAVCDIVENAVFATTQN